MHKKMHVFPQKNVLWPIQFTLKMSGMLMWSIRWEQLSSWAPSQLLKPKCASHNMLVILHLEYVNYPIFLITYIQRIPWISRVVQKLKLNGQRPLSTKAICMITLKNININIKNYFYGNKHHWSSCKGCMRVATWQPLVGVNTLTWSPNTWTWPLPLWHFSTHSKHLQIVRLLSMGRYPCWLNFYKLFDCEWMHWVWLMQERNHPSTKE